MWSYSGMLVRAEFQRGNQMHSVSCFGFRASGSTAIKRSFSISCNQRTNKACVLLWFPVGSLTGANVSTFSIMSKKLPGISTSFMVCWTWWCRFRFTCLQMQVYELCFCTTRLRTPAHTKSTILFHWKWISVNISLFVDEIHTYCILPWRAEE